MSSKFRFIDLFAGIGGFRLALDSYGGECVFSSEWDKDSQQVYSENFGEFPDGDITTIHEKSIPSHDVLCAGFPCQSFSISGKQRGFNDTRGTLFWDIVRIAKYHKPKVLLLENVKNLARHDNGQTLKVILDSLNKLGYVVEFQILRSSDFGVPQARERIFLVGIRNDIKMARTIFPINQTFSPVVVKDILEKHVDSSFIINRSDIVFSPQKNVSNPRRPMQIGKINKGGQGERVYSIEAAGITLSAYGGGAASKTGAYLINGSVRKLTPRECARLQGFPDSFTLHPSKNVAYKQFGNAVSVPVVQSVFQQIFELVFSANGVQVAKKKKKISNRVKYQGLVLR